MLGSVLTMLGTILSHAWHSVKQRLAQYWTMLGSVLRTLGTILDHAWLNIEQRLAQYWTTLGSALNKAWFRIEQAAFLSIEQRLAQYFTMFSSAFSKAWLSIEPCLAWLTPLWQWHVCLLLCWSVCVGVVYSFVLKHFPLMFSYLFCDI